MNSPKPAKRAAPRLLQVLRTQRLSDAMQRVTLSGEELLGFPTDRNGAHIKIFLPRQDQKKPVLPTMGEKGPVWPEAHLRPITRTYSVRRYCAQTNELDVDFVLHGDRSPASQWAGQASAGDYLGVAGPGGPDPLLSPAPQHFLVGDLTALPAISALLEQLPETTKGHVLIEIDHHHHRQEITHNTQMTLHWVLRDPDIPPRSAPRNALLSQLTTLRLPQPENPVSAFVAGENSMVLAARDHLRQAYGLRKHNLYAIPYWRRGQDEEAYHQERHSIMDQVY